jgi:FAD/FMN-containing dehydrogenase
MKLATAQKIPVTPRGAGSNLSGGSVPVSAGIVLCMTRMNKILKIDADSFTVTTEVGVVLNDLNLALAKQNLFFPPDPQSFLAATIGGCVSENAGGPYAVKYGVFKHYLLGMTAVLPNGAIVKTGGEYGEKCHRLRLAANPVRLRGHAGGDNSGHTASYCRCRPHTGRWWPYSIKWSLQGRRCIRF